MLRSCCFPSSCIDCSLHMAGEQGLAWQDRNEQCRSTKGSGETPSQHWWRQPALPSQPRFRSRSSFTFSAWLSSSLLLSLSLWGGSGPRPSSSNNCAFMVKSQAAVRSRALGLTGEGPCLCKARGFSSGLSPLEEEDCCRSRVPGPAQSGDADARVPLEGRGYCRVLSMVGGVLPRGAGGGGGGGGGGWSILRWGPALFCLGTVG